MKDKDTFLAAWAARWARRGGIVTPELLEHVWFEANVHPGFLRWVFS